jgi:hypothetical protein
VFTTVFPFTHSQRKLVLIRTTLTCIKILRGSRSNSSRQDWGGMRILGVLKQRYNLSTSTMSYYRRFHFLMGCHLSIVTPLSKSCAGSSEFGTHFWVALKSKSGTLSFPKSASWFLLLWLKETIQSVATVKCDWTFRKQGHYTPIL